MTWRGYLVQLLQIASSIEHALMVQYLFAAYSLGGEHVKNEGDRQMVARWRNLILSVAKEEMGHLLTVQNVLCLLGAPVELTRENHPWHSDFYPFEFRLERLTMESLNRYLHAEMHDVEVLDTPSKLFLQKLYPMPDPTDLVDSEMPHVGDFYRYIIKVISHPDRIPDADFHADSFRYQASWDDWGRNHNYKNVPQETTQGVVKLVVEKSNEPTRADVMIERAATRHQAAIALTRIAEQGEAAPSVSAGSHFQRFWSIIIDFRDAKESRASDWLPTHYVIENPHTLLPSDKRGRSASTITWPRSERWANLFNIRYGMLLTYLSHSFQLARDGNEELLRGAVVHKVFAEMYNLKAIAGILVQLPLKDPSDERRAGPPFQMPYTQTPPTSAVDRWRQHHDLLRGALQLNDELQNTTDGSILGEERPYLQAMHELDEKSVEWIERVVAGKTRGGVDKR
jgi:hypothetical protein